MLLFTAYHSTDFDVHRNWLAITSTLPLAQWYTEKTSQWTLDYPPFFAHFEWLLAQLVPGVVAADGCLDIVEVGQYSLPTVYFQRLTVVLSEIVLFAALQWYLKTTRKVQHEISRAFVVVLSLVLSPGLLIVDHIHFQYNGLMYGFLVLMINSARLHKYLWCGFWFSVLLCFKHIYLYLAPAVFVFLLRAYCLDLQYSTKRSFLNNAVSMVHWRNLIKLGLIVIAVFGAAFGPFVYHGVMPQLLERLFPFSRGLTHAYWAPNFWAVYSFVDRVLVQVYKRMPMTQALLWKFFLVDTSIVNIESFVNSSTRGLVGDVEFLILPTITPKLTFLLTLFYQVMALIPLFIQPTFERFLGALTLCGYASFLFGWHVHEKAILLVIFPITFLAASDQRLISPFHLLTSCGHVALFPLLFTPEEWILKVVYTLLWQLVYHFLLRKVVKVPKKVDHLRGGLLFARLSNLYSLGLIPVVLFTTIIDIFENQVPILKLFEFLKLMIISVYCGIGVVCLWNGFNWLYFMDETIWESE